MVRCTKKKKKRRGKNLPTAVKPSKFGSPAIAATVALQPGRRRSEDNFIAVSLSSAPMPTELNINLYI